MNIQSWLDAVVQPESVPDLPQSSGLQEDPRYGQGQSAGHRRRKPKRSPASDSSLLELPAEPAKSPSKKHKRAKKVSVPESESGSGSGQSSAADGESADSSASSQRYTRKPRRKTRPERYEPSSTITKERGTHADTGRKGESKRTRRKSRRKKGKDPASGIVQSFHAKNVFGDRLTVECCYVCSSLEVC